MQYEDGWAIARRETASKNVYHIPDTNIALVHKPESISHMLEQIKQQKRLQKDKPFHSPLWALCNQLYRFGWNGTATECYERLKREMAIVGVTWPSVGLTEDAAMEDFMASWDAILASGGDPSVLAYRLALEEPFEHVEGTKFFKILVSLCYHLKDENGKFFLSGTTFGELTGLHQVTAGRLIQDAVKRGYIRMTADYVMKHKAREYVWCFSR